MRWFVLFIAVLPILEIAGFIVIGGQIGLAASFLWLILAALLGVWQFRRLGAMRRRGVADAAGMVLAGLAATLLIVPGFVTDFLALPLLVPGLRSLLVGLGLARLTERARASAGFGSGPANRPAEPEVLEGDYTVLDPDAPPAGPGRGNRPPSDGGQGSSPWADH